MVFKKGENGDTACTERKEGTHNRTRTYYGDGGGKKGKDYPETIIRKSSRRRRG